MEKARQDIARESEGYLHGKQVQIMVHGDPLDTPSGEGMQRRKGKKDLHAPWQQESPMQSQQHSQPQMHQSFQHSQVGPAMGQQMQCQQHPPKADSDQTQVQDAQSWEESDVCAICMDKPKTHVLAPCGHLCVCERCVLAVVNGPCPICRANCISSIDMRKGVFKT